jgi:hypothetical protein
MGKSILSGTSSGTPCAFAILPVAAELAASPPGDGPGNGRETRC